MKKRAKISVNLSLLGALTLSGLFFSAPLSFATVLEFSNGEVKSHIGVDYRNRPDDKVAISTITVVEKIQAPASLQALIEFAAIEYELDPGLITAIIAQESNFDVKAVSPKGAMGLMQLMPDTAESLGVTDAFDAAQNIDGGTRYFKNLLNRYNGDRHLALAAYNAGTRAVDSYGGVPPYAETREYIIRINSYYTPAEVKDEAPAPAEPPKSLLVYGAAKRVEDTQNVPQGSNDDESALPVPETAISTEEIEGKDLPIETQEADTIKKPAQNEDTPSVAEDVPLGFDIEIYSDRVPQEALTVVYQKD